MESRYSLDRSLDEPLLAGSTSRQGAGEKSRRRPPAMWFLHATLAVINLILLITVVSKPRWGTLCAKESVATKSATVNPVGPVLRYEERLFDEGYGGYALNASANNGSRVMFAGRPTLAMDDAWYALYRGKSLGRS